MAEVRVRQGLTDSVRCRGCGPLVVVAYSVGSGGGFAGQG